jgi:transposase
MYDLALREVAKWYYSDMKSMKKVAERMKVGIGTVWRWLNQDKEIAKRCYKPKKLTDTILTFLKVLLNHESTLTQVEMSDRLKVAFGIPFSRKCISTALSKINYTRKQLSKRGITDETKQRARKLAFREEYFASEQTIINYRLYSFQLPLQNVIRSRMSFQSSSPNLESC